MTSAPRAVVHFDIDGTLLRCGDVPRRALAEALHRTFGTSGAIAEVRFGGKTDRLIVAEALATAPPWDDPRWSGFWQAYVHALDAGFRDAPPIRLPGARELLGALRESDVYLSLVTGNVPAGAEVKLRHAGLAPFFDPPPATAAYAPDAATKAELGHTLRERSARTFGEAMASTLQVVVGDTAADVACARVAGFRAVAVATGAFGAEELSAASPDALLTSLEPMADAMEAILEGRPAVPARAGEGRPPEVG